MSVVCVCVCLMCKDILKLPGVWEELWGFFSGILRCLVVGTISLAIMKTTKSVSSGSATIWLNSNTGLSNLHSEHIPILVWGLAILPGCHYFSVTGFGPQKVAEWVWFLLGVFSTSYMASLLCPQAFVMIVFVIKCCDDCFVTQYTVLDHVYSFSHRENMYNIPVMLRTE